MGSVLFHCPQMTDLANEIVKQDLDINLGVIEWKVFPDGFPNLYIEKVDDIREKEVAFLASFDTPEDIAVQLMAAYALPHRGAERFKFILPYYPTGTMERIEDEGEVATAMSVARMIGAMPQLERGLTSAVIYDIHSLQSRDSFANSNVIPRFKSGIKYLKAILEGRDVTIAFPDYGAFRRFRKKFYGPRAERQFPYAICDKIRDGEKVMVTLRDGDVRGRDVVIVDDIIMGGGTLIECKNALVQAGAKSVSAYATHAKCPNQSWKKFIDAGFEKIWVTNSCPYTAKELAGIAPFEVISLAGSIARVIAR